MLATADRLQRLDADCRRPRRVADDDHLACDPVDMPKDEYRGEAARKKRREADGHSDKRRFRSSVNGDVLSA